MDNVNREQMNDTWVLVHHPTEALIFRNVEDCWQQLKSTYTNYFSGLVYGGLPEEHKLLQLCANSRKTGNDNLGS